MRAATSDLLTVLSNGALTAPASAPYFIGDFQKAVRLADSVAGQQKVLLDFSKMAQGPVEPHVGRREPAVGLGKSMLTACRLHLPALARFG